MDSFKILEIKQSVYESNDREARLLRDELKREGPFLLNLMSSPGAGKTTTLERTIEQLKDELRIGVIEADIDSDVDARRVLRTGVRVIQLHSGGMCHLDAGMTRQGLEGLGTEDLDLVFLENIGNLICTAEFDTGASRSAMILSVPEGDDKPLKYPLMFSMVDVLLINKIDTMSLFDFDLETVRERVATMNPRISKIIPISAKTGEGIGEWADWIRSETDAWRTASRNRGGRERSRRIGPLRGIQHGR
jgi:hydrogenase nickel incorporation protein HypB